MQINAPSTFSQPATFSSSVTLNGLVSFGGQLDLPGGQLLSSTSGTISLGTSSQQNFVLRRPDASPLTSPGVNLLLQAGRGTPNGSVVVGHATDNAMVRLLSSTTTTVDSAGSVSIGPSATSIQIGAAGVTTSVTGTVCTVFFCFVFIFIFLICYFRIPHIDCHRSHSCLLKPLS